MQVTTWSSALRDDPGVESVTSLTSERLILASASPRRRELIALTGWPVSFHPTSVDEARLPGESGRELTRRLAILKARAAAPDDEALVLAADTTVVHGNTVLEKPIDAAQARVMLQELRGHPHTVVTSIALRRASHPGGGIPEGIAVRAPDGTLLVDSCESSVPMRDYGDEEIERYLAGGSPFDKAGGYGIQDGLFEPVDRRKFRDCFANVMGLPLCHVVRTLRRVGVEPAGDVPAACMAHLDYDCPVSEAILGGEA